MADGYGRYGLSLALGQMLAKGFQDYRAMNLDKEKADQINATQNKALDIGEREATRKFNWDTDVFNKSQSDINRGNVLNASLAKAQNEASILGLNKWAVEPTFGSDGLISGHKVRKLSPEEIKYKQSLNDNSNNKSVVSGTRQNPDGSVTVIMSDGTTKVIPAVIQKQETPVVNNKQESKPFIPWTINFMSVDKNPVDQSQQYEPESLFGVYGNPFKMKPRYGIPLKNRVNPFAPTILGEGDVNPIKIQDINFDFKNKGYDKLTGMGLQVGGNILGFLNNYIAAPTVNGIIDLGMFIPQKGREIKTGIKDWFAEEYK